MSQIVDNQLGLWQTRPRSGWKTLPEAVDELTGKYGQSVAEFNAVENEILGMADTLSNGIIAQFPSHFR